ncbi:MAG: hypothetical protein COV47_05990 [Candidatus Diapherotrites archaeon CG11_big_fil_rev_8_21_14_0_20_37_9]|nr:MAG: hypothetical protein COV47_05990 [Candidatus Diapherotrites archaeon CG11_big_fil_rev_8_21_14_0_20_37_9]
MEEKDFLNELNEVKKTEIEKEKIIVNANKQAEKIISKAHADSKEILSVARDEADKAEEAELKKGKDDISKEEEKIIAKAMKDAETVAGKKAGKALIAKCIKELTE